MFSAFLRFKLEELSPSSLLKDSRFPKDLTIEVMHFSIDFKSKLSLNFIIFAYLY